MSELVKAWEVCNKSHTLVLAIPKSIRACLKLKNGARFWMSTKGRRIVLTPIKEPKE